jgi:hypothetical protein
MLLVLHVLCETVDLGKLHAIIYELQEQIRELQNKQEATENVLELVFEMLNELREKLNTMEKKLEEEQTKLNEKLGKLGVLVDFLAQSSVSKDVLDKLQEQVNTLASVANAAVTHDQYQQLSRDLKQKLIDMQNISTQNDVSVNVVFLYDVMSKVDELNNIMTSQYQTLTNELNATKTAINAGRLQQQNDLKRIVLKMKEIIMEEVDSKCEGLRRKLEELKNIRYCVI